MGIKERFKNYFYNQKEIEQLQEQIDVLETKITKTNKPLSINPTTSIYTTSKDNILIEYIEIRSELDTQIKKLLREQKDLENIIDSLESPLHRLLMRSRYIDNKSWQEVSKIMNYSWRQVHYIHKRALKKIEKF